MDLPVRVLLRNQNRAITHTAVTATVMPWVIFTTMTCCRPVTSRKDLAVIRKRSPSVNTRSSGPITKRTMPL
jgi:hypothetical protein